MWKPKDKVSNSTTTKSFKYSRSNLFEIRKMNDFVRKTPKFVKSPLIPRTSFQNETPSFNFQWNYHSYNQIDETYKWFSQTTNKGPKTKWVPKVC